MMDLIGFVKGLSNEAYHSGPGVSKSDLSLILRSPQHYKAKDQRKDTAALAFGASFHCAVLEPDVFSDHYIVKSADMDYRTKEGKSWKAMAESSGKAIISIEQWRQIQNMRAAIMAHETAFNLLSGDVEHELSAFWQDPVFDVLCKARFDVLNKSTQICVDLKTCLDARPQAVTRDAYKYGWHMQAFWYSYALQILSGAPHEFYFIAVEKDPPYGVCVYRASEEMKQEGGIQCQRALEVYADCLKKDEWPGYSQEVVSLELPGWIKRKNMMEEYEIFE
jgi:exodeoxyribonuclease VIII